MSSSYQELVDKLQQLFGSFDAETKRFEIANNSIIARNLGYSDAQFSRLINGTATEGEYVRANQNVDRILKIRSLETQLEKLSSQPNTLSLKPTWVVLAIVFFIAFISVLFLFFFQKEPSVEVVTPERDYTLNWAFESSFINPFVKLDDLPDNCDYPCYKYQGKWNLEKSYKLPFFRERNGFHYLATEVEMYGRCMVEKSEKGDLIEGYEYQKHEIWYDLQERSIEAFMINSNTPSENYQQLDFEQESSFIKVANIHTFFRNEFLIGDTAIYRTGKVIGRDLELVPREVLKADIRDEAKLNDIAQELNRIINNRLEDFSVPIQCSEALLISENPADIEDGDKMSFQCQLTTGGFPITYVKTYILKDQYIKNDCVSEAE